jgi:hypothetical protein
MQKFLSILAVSVLLSAPASAAVSSFGGFLGIPVQPSTFFTDMRNGSDTLFGPDQFGSYASFPTATDIPDSSGDSFLGLQYSVGANTYYGFARFAGGDLEGYGFQTTPGADIDANNPAAPELTTWAWDSWGWPCSPRAADRFASPDAKGARDAPSLRRRYPRIPAYVGIRSVRYSFISAVTCAATDRESPSRS